MIEEEYEEMVDNLERVAHDIEFALKYYEPEDLPHKPIRMTVTDEDVIAIRKAVKHLSEDARYKWRFCKECNERIFKDEIEGDTFKIINGDLYCIDCANDK